MVNPKRVGAEEGMRIGAIKKTGKIFRARGKDACG
jgi:hypothetical protein